MFNKLNYSYKFFYFTLLLVLVFFTVYKVAISDSVKLYSENERLKKELSKIEQTDSLIKVLERQQNNLKRKSYSNGNFQEYLLKTIANLTKKHKTNIIKIPQTHYYLHQNLKIETYRFTLEGNFKNLTYFINDLNNEIYPATINSINYQRIDDYSKNKKKLQVALIIQIYKPKSHETFNENNIN
tara:strand:+ start:5754 stop:6305 length:552 start_codon:yes stop_codon:yes gene_type:complete